MSNSSQKTVSGIRIKIEKSLSSSFDFFDLIGSKLFGDWWSIIYLSIQDAVALAILVKIPSLFAELITGKKFDDLQTCMQNTTWSSESRYACLVVIMWNMSGWIILTARLLRRLIESLAETLKGVSQGGGNTSGKQP